MLRNNATNMFNLSYDIFNHMIYFYPKFETLFVLNIKQ
jgi:hypothetical protein